MNQELKEATRAFHEKRVSRMFNLRQQGWTLAQIGEALSPSITCERVRQCLQKQYGSANIIEWVSANRLAQLLGRSFVYIKARINSGELKPRRNGNRCLFRTQDIEFLKDKMRQFCLVCGREILVGFGRLYCPNCSFRLKRNRWPILTLEGKWRRQEATRRWKQNHPLKAKAIQSKADKRQREKHYKNTWYEIPASYKKVQAIGARNGSLILTDGTSIPMFRTRKCQAPVIEQKGGGNEVI